MTAEVFIRKNSKEQLDYDLREYQTRMYKCRILPM